MKEHVEEQELTQEELAARRGTSQQTTSEFYDIKFKKEQSKRTANYRVKVK